MAVPFEADESELAGRERDKARIEKGGPLLIRAEKLEKGDSAAVGGAVGEVEIARRGVTLAVGWPESPSFTPKQHLDPHTVKAYSSLAAWRYGTIHSEHNS
ncbi:hypothetical protein [Ramlibacter montanisoli]|uniref:Uncharacterized protein n=1 Tax=Ramlibacter montanisoli TaxID=2732512 RepID=A0A849KAX9_9BURK|nr:hypothetical protein [Ramlibacter montanisoli]NNU43584.1 hypothetical protein [Ramlibacter montanisoli]